MVLPLLAGDRQALVEPGRLVDVSAAAGCGALRQGSWRLVRLRPRRASAWRGRFTSPPWLVTSRDMGEEGWRHAHSPRRVCPASRETARLALVRATGVVDPRATFLRTGSEAGDARREIGAGLAAAAGLIGDLGLGRRQGGAGQRDARLLGATSAMTSAVLAGPLARVAGNRGPPRRSAPGASVPLAAFTTIRNCPRRRHIEPWRRERSRGGARCQRTAPLIAGSLTGAWCRNRPWLERVTSLASRLRAAPRRRPAGGLSCSRATRRWPSGLRTPQVACGWPGVRGGCVPKYQTESADQQRASRAGRQLAGRRAALGLVAAPAAVPGGFVAFVAAMLRALGAAPGVADASARWLIEAGRSRMRSRCESIRRSRIPTVWLTRPAGAASAFRSPFGQGVGRR